MKFVFPIEDKTAEELYQLNRQGAGGFYPIGANSAYHGGLHFEGNHSVVAIADGTLIAYRYTDKYLEEKVGNKTFKYSNSFILIRHEFLTPKGQKLIFYSHYNHLCPWGEFNDQQRARALPFVVKRYGIATDTLHVRKGPSTSSATIPNKVLKKGHAVVASPVDENWARIEGTSEYFHYKDYTTEEQLVTPKLDQIVCCEIPLKAGALLGYTGLCEAEGIPQGYTTVHVEVFAGNDAEEFLKNPKKDGTPTQFLIAEGTPLFHRDSKYPNASAIQRITRPAGTSVKVSNQPTTGDWVQVTDTKLVATVDRSWLTWNAPAQRYTATSDHVADVTQAFSGGATVDTSTKFELLAKLDGAVARRTIALSVNSSTASPYWVKRSWLDKHQTLTADHTDCLADNPAAPLFSRTVGTVEYEAVVDGRHAETDLDGTTAWYKVNPCGIEGWVSEANIKKCSPYDWPGFKVAKEDEPDRVLATIFPLTSTARDRRIDYDKLPSFFKKLFDEIDTDADSKGIITPREMKNALAKPPVAYKLSRLVCYHQSEWCADETTTSYWQAVLTSLGQPRADNLTARIKNVCWWNTVSNTTRHFPTRSVYHWHPVAFLEHMALLNAFTWARTPFADLLASVESRGDYTAYNRLITTAGKESVQSFFGTDLTSLTISTIQEKQKADEMFAVGKFQLIPLTLEAAINKLQIDRSLAFTPDVQDQIFADYLIRAKKPAIIRYLEGDGDLETALYACAQEWASVGVRAKRQLYNRQPAKGDESYYDGDGLNKALITAKQMADALSQSKQLYK